MIKLNINFRFLLVLKIKEIKIEVNENNAFVVRSLKVKKSGRVTKKELTKIWLINVFWFLKSKLWFRYQNTQNDMNKISNIIKYQSNACCF